MARQRRVRRVERHALNMHGVAVHLNACAHLLQLIPHSFDSVGLFQAQTARVGDDCFATAKAAQREQDRPQVRAIGQVDLGGFEQAAVKVVAALDFLKFAAAAL